jgi:mRNA interferase MazF
MKQAGRIALVPFPFTDLSGAKLRPILMIPRTSPRFDVWLLCMVSSQLHQADQALDEVVESSDRDFGPSGLKTSSVLRLSRLAVIDGGMITGSLGSISADRLASIRRKLANWIVADCK